MRGHGSNQCVDAAEDVGKEGGEDSGGGDQGDDLLGVSARLRAAMGHPEPAHTTLHEATGLLREVTDTAETLFTDVLRSQVP